MIPITLEVSDDLARRLQAVEDRLPRILELGLRELNASAQAGFSSASEVLEFLANLPTPEEILALRPSRGFEERIRTLLEKNRSLGLSPEEEQEWELYQYLEHLVRLAKARAATKLRGKTESQNLALSCTLCNKHKGSDLASLDPETGKIVPLFHPRRDHWVEHFSFIEGMIVPKTAIGRVTARLLQY